MWHYVKLYAPLVVLELVCLVLIIFGSLNIKEAIGQQAAIDSGTIVEAEITGIRSTSSGSDFHHKTQKFGYYTVYTYEDENGISYSGTFQTHLTKEEAQEQIGNAVQVYIDGKGASILVGAHPRAKTGYAVIIAVFSVLFLLIALFPLLIKLWLNRKSKRKA